MEITKEEFEKRLDELSSRNWKVRNILRDCGGYDKLDERVKLMIDKQIGITRSVIMHNSDIGTDSEESDGDIWSIGGIRSIEDAEFQFLNNIGTEQKGE